jgi:hypothetical protein
MARQARQVKTVKTETISVRHVGSVDERFGELAQIHSDRHELYGDDYLRVGPSLAGIFPGGLELRTPADFTRFALLTHIHGKLLRYAARFHDGGSEDSLDDLSVYAQLLRHADDVTS